MQRDSGGEVTLYHFPASLCSQKGRLALAEKGVRYASHMVNIGPRMENYEPWYMRINPRGVVPTLDHGGHIVTDSARIVRYIDEHFDGPELTWTVFLARLTFLGFSETFGASVQRHFDEPKMRPSYEEANVMHVRPPLGKLLRMMRGKA